ncbi:MAG: glycosidase, partial [Pedobacter sp.]
MTDIAKRFPGNPILKPADIKPSRSDLKVICLLNPGAFLFEGKIWLILRVAENAISKEGYYRYPVIDEREGIKLLDVPADHPDLNTTDARVHNYKGVDYLTTLSHLRLVCSTDGIHFYEPDGFEPL